MRLTLLCFFFLSITSTFAFGQTMPTLKPPGSLPAALSAEAIDYSAEPVVIEQLDHIYTMAADGTGVRQFTVAVRVHSDASVRQLGVLSLPYASSSEHVELVYVRVRRPDGSVTETPATEAIEMPSPVTTAAPFYSDLKELQIPVRNLRVGDRLEWQAKIIRTKPEAPGQFWGEENFISDTVTLSQSVELHVPKEIYVNVYSPTSKPTETTTAFERVCRWQYSQTKPTIGPEAEAEKERKKKQALTAEQELEEKEGKFPSIAWSTFKSWEAVGDWYRSLEGDRILPDTDVKAKVAELTAGKTTQEEKVRALYNYVSTQIRYIGVDFGIGRYQPHHAAEVLQNQYGDCKDKHTLLAAMLNVIGLHPDAVLIGAGIRFNPPVPSPQAFNHLITGVSLEGKPVWLDATAEVAPYRVLNYALRDKNALVVPVTTPETAPDTARARIERTPATLPFPAIQKMDAVGTLDNTGTSNSRLVLTLRGNAELFARTAFHQVSPGQYDQLVQQLSQGMGYAGTTNHAEVSRPEDTADPLKISYDYKREKAGDWDNLRIVPQVAPVSIPRSDEKDPPVRSINLGIPRSEISTSAMKLPIGWGAELPEAVHVKSPYATYDETYRFENGTLYAERRIEVLQEKVPIADWKAYKKFADAADLGNEKFIQLTGKGTKSAAGDAASSSSPSNDKEETHTLIQAAGSALQRRDLDEARSLLDDAKRINPEQLLLWTTYGYLELARYQLPTAVEDFQKEISLHPNAYQPYGPMAHAQKMLNQRKEAKDSLQKWATLQQDNPQPSLQLANMLLEDDDPAGAVAAAEEGVAHLPEDQKKNEPLQLLLGRAQMKGRMKEKGHATLLALLNTTEDPGTMNDCAYELADAGVELPLAESTTQTALKKMVEQSKTWTLDENPQTLRSKTNYITSTWDTLGWILFREGKLDEAQNYIHAAWLNQQSSEVAEHLAEIARARGRKDEALRYLELALASFPAYDLMGVRTKPGSRQRYITERAETLRKQGAKSTPQAPYENSHTRLEKVRTVSLGPAAGLNGTSEFRLLLTGGKIAKSEKIGTKDLPGASERVKGADLNAFWPTGSDASLVRNAILNCHGGICELVFEP
jgi:tetratricopeptide (TPR) repeat protein